MVTMGLMAGRRITPILLVPFGQERGKMAIALQLHLTSARFHRDSFLLTEGWMCGCGG